MGRIVPMYSWNKGILKLNERSGRLTKKVWFQGVLLLGCVVVAMLLANLPGTRDWYHNILSTNFQIHIFSETVDISFPFGMTVEKFINDVLMVLFFFTVGLEIRREISRGELSSVKKALMPVIAAFGGVLVPAVVYTIVNHGTMASSGWGIPTATDIAFAVCILSVLGDRVPVSLKVFLTALAIVDDLIAILVVALFYGGTINLHCLGIAVLVIIFALILNRIGEKSLFPYVLCALAVWGLFYYSGIHSTMAGVVMAFIIPSQSLYNKAQYYRKRNVLIDELEKLDSFDDSPFPNEPQKYCLRKLESVAHGAMSMSYRLENALLPWVNFLIMPLFALANAGVTVSDPSFFNVFAFNPIEGSVSLGIFLGLLLGKPLGITLFSWLAIKTKVGLMPDKASWKLFFAVACLGGIGFTMSIFVDTLSFSDLAADMTTKLRDAGKIAVLMGSIASAILGSLLITYFGKRNK